MLIINLGKTKEKQFYPQKVRVKIEKLQRNWNILQTDANEIEMRKKLKLLTVRLAIGPSLTVHFADKELNVGHCTGVEECLS